MASSPPPPPPPGHELPFRSASALKKRVQRSTRQRTGFSKEPGSPSNCPSATPHPFITTNRSPHGNTEGAGAGPSNVSTVDQPLRKRAPRDVSSTIRDQTFTYPAILHAIEQSDNRRALLELLQQELQAIQRDPNDDDGNQTMPGQGIRQLTAAIRETEIDIAEQDREAVLKERSKRAKSLRTTIGPLSTKSHGQTITSGPSGWPSVTGQRERQGITARSRDSGGVTPLEGIVTTGRFASSSAGRGTRTPSKQSSRQSATPACRRSEHATRSTTRTSTPDREKETSKQAAAATRSDIPSYIDAQTRAHSQSSSLSGDKRSTKANPEINDKATGQSVGTRGGAASPSSGRSQPVMPCSSSAAAVRTVAQKQAAELEIAALWRSARKETTNPSRSRSSSPASPQVNVRLDSANRGARADTAGPSYNRPPPVMPRSSSHWRPADSGPEVSDTPRGVAGPSGGQPTRFLPAPSGQMSAAASGATSSGIRGDAAALPVGIPSHVQPSSAGPCAAAASGPVGNLAGGNAADPPPNGPGFFPPLPGAVGNAVWTNVAGQAIGIPGIVWGLPIGSSAGIPGFPMPPLGDSSTTVRGTPVGMGGFPMPLLDGSSAAVRGATGPLIGIPGFPIPPEGSSDAVVRRASDPPRSIPGPSLSPLVGNWVAAGSATVTDTGTGQPSLPTASPIPNVGGAPVYGAHAGNTAFWNAAGAQASDRPGAAIISQDRYWGAAVERQTAGTASDRAGPSTVEKGNKEGVASKSSGSKRRAAAPPGDIISSGEQRDAGAGSGARGATGSLSSRMGPPASKQASRQRDSASTTGTEGETGNTRIEQEDAEDELHWTDLIEYHQPTPDGDDTWQQ
ncbi:hypothetical protein EPUS_09373 [Endocarpon pusillum Z07020]|uniref:Uncharacterized protein n=1 Tax=Endocarpon pusillum (strain Z07020 / HMAS-L-300199) TaxID=1263415 RepID=U1I108_ENDPU|nr:uncharacterized protein EPUS_09373 [Endocarpon pusillum Z07020]ERF75574.1 hypothetical protein EPUS_09373 [Endocarpon pusillum Z07020]